MNSFAVRMVALGFAAAFEVASALPAAAGPLPVTGPALTAAAPDHAVDVYWRGRWWGPGLGVGLAAGVIAGAAIAAPYYGYGAPVYGAPMYGPPVYGPPVYAVPTYPPVVYGAPYAYGPVYGGYYGYGYRRGGCATDEGYGRFAACSGR